VPVLSAMASPSTPCPSSTATAARACRHAQSAVTRRIPLASAGSHSEGWVTRYRCELFSRCSVTAHCPSMRRRRGSRSGSRGEDFGDKPRSVREIKDPFLLNGAYFLRASLSFRQLFRCAEPGTSKSWTPTRHAPAACGSSVPFTKNRRRRTATRRKASALAYSGELCRSADPGGQGAQVMASTSTSRSAPGTNKRDT
jgi:hypothetical protein